MYTSDSNSTNTNATMYTHYPPGDLPSPGTEPHLPIFPVQGLNPSLMSPVFAGSLPRVPPGKPIKTTQQKKLKERNKRKRKAGLSHPWKERNGGASLEPGQARVTRLDCAGAEGGGEDVPAKRLPWTCSAWSSPRMEPPSPDPGWTS